MAKKITKKEDEKEVGTATIEVLTTKLLDLMGIRAKISVESDEDEGAILINIEAGEEAGLIIGNRGMTLIAIQTIVGMMFKKKVGEWRRIVVNVADWRQKEEERLKRLAEQAAERAKTTGQPQHLYNLSSSQRRIIHLNLAEDASIETASQGEGRDRYLVITPK
ncbi:MAG: Single-stranded nucleic acid binding R3H domain protein [Candidatus Woesebacteria bacterium GW2011_GWB1_39_12]|uniref:Single-stranded nucleic acid binding R3H domain protein n=2 Tax=Candidatus Woeseibacteriota TaxID=1752722 RepID=A0A0G0PIQ4_9BACT|nr:MAG: Single-stranded nucleic acid binding R3H domain protein [Candidatus Woesebacteria bacterium GW2011_GWA1_39_12]KKR00088.1 MAG: Single-stranded nucleic acid binding R3H domain protein [Candidatus Woesebacteria bacterium GW2011_GWB1_39_12]